MAHIGLYNCIKSKCNNVRSTAYLFRFFSELCLTNTSIKNQSNYPDSLKRNYFRQVGIKLIFVVFFSFLAHAAQAQGANILYFVSDDTNELYTIDRFTGTVTLVGATGRSNIEAIAYYPIPGSETLYAADAGDFGTLNRTTGAFTLIGEIDGGGTADGSAGPQTLNDVDGLMLDGQSLIMWAIERKAGSIPDLLFQINLSTGQYVADAFGSGVDYLEIVGEGIDVDVDDLAVDPVSGEIYGVSNNNGADDVLIKVNKTTGEFELVAALAEDDVEGLAFHNDGKLYGSEGDAENRLILINKSTGAVSNYLSLAPGGDVEALAALVAPSNFIEGNVFEDDDLDGIKDPSETGIANVTVYLYLDQNGDGQVDPEDTRIQSTTTDSNGDYSFFYITTGTLITKTETASHPSGYSLTTDNFETMTFTDGVNFGETDSDNDFGLGTGSDCDGDGITDFFEGELDSDGDGIQNKCDLDSDNDGLRDDVEGSEDYDDDGIPNYLDRDSDDDGIPDAIEANGGIRPTEYVASQGNLSGTDSDGNGIIDSRETSAGSGVTIAPNPDSDGDGYIDILDLDSDNDGILDLREAGATVDSDNDGQVDNITDVNGNGYADILESAPLAIPNTDLFYENSNGLTKRPNYIDIDSDADGIDDTREGQSTIGYRSITLFGDNDEDGILDFWDISNGKYPITPVDTDGDGSPDYVDTNSDNDPESDFIEGNDADNNGLADESNSGLDANGNGLDDQFDSGCSGVVCSSNVSLPDTDNDNEYDFRDFEGAPIDTDGDGIPDATDIDDDNDGILDVNESEVIDTDGDGIVNSLDLDSDGDGILDIIEAGGVDTDNDGRVDDDTDTDNDGWANTFDSNNGGTALTNPDTDGDGIRNFLDLDSDGDGVVDLIESQATTGSPIVPSGSDSDGDGIDNAFDVTGGTPITPVDSESDGIPDYLDSDSDNDGFPDLLEAWDTDGDYVAETSPTGGDSDVDGLDNAFDLVAGPNSTTNTYNNQDALDFPDETTSGLTSERDWREDNEVDSDGDGQINSIDIDDDDDGILDTVEGQGDFDKDGVINSLDLDSDNDGIPDIIEAGGVDTDDDGRVDNNTDTDDDGWADTFDSDNGGTALSNPDTDSDGLKNFLDIDSDGDGIVDLIESQVTTVSPITPSGTDSDLDGLDDSFDTDNGGTPSDPIDSDGDTTPDYLDLNSDNDDFTDALEGWDTNGDLIAETTHSGTDTDGDGLDDAYDDVVGPNSTTNPTNSQTALAFPDVTTAGDSERDWRETNDEDADFDGIPDNTDIDDDNDGILDVDEGESTDTDGDGIVDRLDLDSDNDGIPDIVEAGGVDSNKDGRVDNDTDTDNDGWANTFDNNNGGTALENPDTDNDGIKDYLDLDSDNDGIPDIIEAGGLDNNDDGFVDSATDSDEDGWANTFDSDNGGTALANPDTDSDGLANNIDIDADGDGIVDLIESQATTSSPIVPSGTDTDGDGIDNAFDSDNGGTPITPVDTDSDSTPDYIDFNSDNDSFSDLLEGWDTDNNQVANTTPAGLDSDGDGLDNAFDLVVGPNATTNVYNNQDANDFPDVSTSALTSERDWREENVLDADFDGIPDGTDIDDDNDGILDVDEGEFTDSDGDGIVDRLDLDSDNDGIPDIIEAGGVDNNNDGKVDNSTDTDGDGWANTFDSDNGGTALTDPDSDNDGVENRIDRDSDNDGILDVTELGRTDANGDGKIDGFIDSNGNGYNDTSEGGVLVIPNSDASYESANGLPSLPNYIDIDSDADGIDDTREGYSTLNYQFPNSFADSDGDGILNFWDVDSGNSPIDPVDTDGAGLDDYVDTNSDNDSLSDFIEGNDFNEDGVADTNNLGVDANGNGLDDAFDQKCYGMSVSSIANSYGEEDNSDGTMYIDSSDLELVYDGGVNGDQTVGIYFPNITIPQGATINSAYIQFRVDETSSGLVNLTIEGQLATNPLTFSTSSNNVTSRTRTSADVSWSPGNWVAIGDAGAAQRTVNIASIIQEIVNQGGWGSGKPLVIIISGPSDTDTRIAEVNPTLTINYGSGITACSSNVALQDADIDGEKDWRDSNGIEAPADSDADGIPDIDDVDDDNDGILDADEGCVDTSVTGANASSASEIVARVSTPSGGVDGANGNFARFRDNGALMEVQLRGGNIVQAGTQITVRAQKTNGAEANTMIITESSDGSNYVNEIEYSFATAGVYENKTYTLTTDATHIRISFLRSGGDLRVDNVSYESFRIPCTGVDTDSDGILDHLDIDADGDGIVDLIESQATTGSPIVPLGIDTDGDGYDDAFDGDCAPCGAITGVPTVAVDTDGDLTPDFRDFNSDNDSFSDALEGWDTDGNLVANTLPSGTDSDGDGLDDAYDIVNGINSTTNVYNDQDAYDFPDETTGGNIERDWREENAADTDFDGIIDTNDIDDDNDGILDVDEGEVADADGDGIPNSLDLDSDNDGIPDIIEAGGIDLNKDGRVDNNTDTDDDGWANTFDSDNGGTALADPDTDNDGINDYLDLDSDNDGLFDIIEAGGVDTNNDGVVDSATDADGDGWANTFDSNNGGTALVNPDTDGDGIRNNLDIDSDGDGIVDLIESQATTGTPIVPIGTDTDGDGIDNAFDSDNGGTPVNPEDTDGDGTPDYLDFNSDGDSLTDIIEGWDSDGNLVANTTPSGNDTDGDGLDDSFDQVSGPNSTTNVYNNQDALDFPDVTTSGGTDRDWREASAIDTDSDGIADLDDIDDDNDGILDVDESCIDVSVGAGTATGVTVISADVANPGNVIDGNLGTRADFNNEGATLQVELRSGGAIAAGTDITINGERRNNTTQMVVSESTDGVTFGNAVTYSFGARRSIEDVNHTLATNATHIRIEAINYDDDIRIYEVDYPAFLLPCTGTDSDNDGIPNHLDLDSDNDGIPDIVEAGGVDVNNDGRVDNYTESGSNGWADIFDNIEGAGTPLTDPDNDTDDFENRIDIDSDGDGINDLIESQATTGSPVVPVGSDLDEDGIDDAFDVNCIPCGGVTGVPTSPVDTDGDSTPDYLDVDSDNDGLNDVIEAWDTDGDYLPDTTPNGNDDDDDGLDDNFDDVVGPNSTTNVYNNQDANDFPDITTSGETTERDWRETNEELCEPGGVDGNILFWVKADNGGTSWRDISNNFENVSAFGTVNNGSLINFNPSNYFNGTAYYNTTLSINANTYSDLAVITVYQPAVNNAGSVWGEDNGGFDRYILDASGATENNAVSNGTSNTSNVSGLYSTASTVMSTVLFYEDASGGSSVYVNGDQVITFTSDHGGETSNTLQIGAKGNGTQRFKGLISELIVYNQLLTSDTDLQQIHSYLALKYGITLSANINGDYIASDASTLFWDASDNVGFQNNVAGIARDDNTCLNQVQSRSSNSDAIVSIGLDDDNDGLEASNSLNTSSFDGDLSAAVWGHDGASLYDHDENIDFDKLQVQSRLNREWRIRETGTIGTVTVRFKVSNLLGPSGIGTNDESQIVMLVDADGDFSSGAQMITQSFVVANDGYVSFQVDFADGTYFTLASGQQYALPITLLSFEAIPKDDYIQLEWSTTTEENNSYFRLEKLINEMDFEPIGYVDGAGNSTELNEYSFRDTEPSLGYNYYRLVDVDFGGNENASEVIMVNFESKELVPKPYPNPVRVGESFSLDIPQNTNIENIQLVSMNGQLLRFEKREEWNKLIISSSELRQGIYLFSFTINGQRYQSKLMVVN